MTLASVPTPHPEPPKHEPPERHASSPRTAALLRHILTTDPRCRRRWLRHAQRSGRHHPNQSGVSWVLALTLWERGEVPEQKKALPRSLKDRVSRALSGRQISLHTLGLFIEAFQLTIEQEQQLYAAWEADHGHTETLSEPAPETSHPPMPPTLLSSVRDARARRAHSAGA